MVGLVLAAVLWVAWHVGVSGTRLRDAIVARIGENAFRGIFSLGSVLTIVLLIVAYNGTPSMAFWVIPSWLQWLLVLAMLPACILLVGSVATRNPTMVAPAASAAKSDIVRGMIRVTRHPMLWAVAIWAATHVIADGDTASLLFFGAFLITALAGMPSIDAKLARGDPTRWQAMARATSLGPGVAIAEGRNRLVLAELWLPILAGVILWLVLLFAHQWILGVSPMPG